MPVFLYTLGRLLCEDRSIAIETVLKGRNTGTHVKIQRVYVNTECLGVERQDQNADNKQL